MEESEKCFLNLLKEISTNAAVHVGLAALSWRSGSVDPCIIELDRALRMMRIPANMVISSPVQLGDLFALIGEILRPNKQFEAAKAAYVMAVEMNCDLPEVHRGLAEVFLRDNHPEKALEHLQTALKLSDNHAPILRKRGEIYAQMGNTRAARFWYSQAGL